MLGATTLVVFSVVTAGAFSPERWSDDPPEFSEDKAADREIDKPSSDIGRTTFPAGSLEQPHSLCSLYANASPLKIYRTELRPVVEPIESSVAENPSWV